MKTISKNTYKVVARVNGSAVTLNQYDGLTAITTAGVTTAAAFGGQNQIQVVASSTPGTATVVFELIDTTAPSVVIASKSITYTTVKTDDITGYTVDAVTAPIFAASTATTSGALTAAQLEYKGQPKVYGQTSGGTKVVLGGGFITGAYVDNSKDFFVVDNSFNTTNGNYDGVKVYARELDNNRTTATTNVTIAFKGVDGKIRSLSTPITSSTDTRVAKELNLYADTQLAGVKADGNTVYIDITQLGSAGFVSTKTLDGFVGTKSGVYFKAKDQYGKEAAPLSYFGYVTNNTVNTATGVVSGTASSNNFSVSASGVITVGAVADGDNYTVTAVTSNGLAKAVKIVFTSHANFLTK